MAPWAHLVARQGIMTKLLVIGLLPVAAACTPGSVPASTPTVGNPATRRDSSCVAAFDSLRAVFRHDYAGFREKVAGHQAALAALADSVRAVAQTSDQYQICIPALQRWARFFHDPHITGPWQAAPPGPAAVASPSPPGSRGSPADDPDWPSLEFLDDSTALVRLPSFEPRYKPVIDSLLGSDGQHLRATRYMIVDVRGNGGGYTGAYDSLVPLLAGNPVHYYGIDVLASRANIAWYQAQLDSDFLAAGDRALIAALIHHMERHIGHFVQLAPDTIITPSIVLPMPQRVAVLVDSGCASSCEDLVLEAQQSRKVTIMGPTHTAGVHDYGEVRALWLPGWRRVRVPTARAGGPRIDNVGIAPEVVIPAATPDAVAFARRYLYSRASEER
jgi:hypothetical protein